MNVVSSEFQRARIVLRHSLPKVLEGSVGKCVEPQLAGAASQLLLKCEWKSKRAHLGQRQNLLGRGVMLQASMRTSLQYGPPASTSKWCTTEKMLCPAAEVFKLHWSAHDEAVGTLCCQARQHTASQARGKHMHSSLQAST